MICDSLLHHFTANNKDCSALFITGQDDVPSYTYKGVKLQRDDMSTSHEEAGVIIPTQVQKAMDEGYRNVQVICDDTDVFILLVYYYQVNDWKNDVLLASLDESKRLISIKSTVEKHKSIVAFLPAMHALSGCDTVPMMCGIGKIGALTAINKNPLPFLGNLCAPTDEVIHEAKSFVASCYGVKDCIDMSKIR